jgi:uncharacterized protein (DUF362 family)
VSDALPKAVVALTRCDQYTEQAVNHALTRQFALLGGIEKFVARGECVLIKPNLIAPKPRCRAVQTDPAVIVGVSKLLKDFGARPFVADSPAWGNVYGCVKALGLEDALKKIGVPVKQLDKPVWRRVGAGRIKVGISSVALGADKIVNLPKFKTHQQLVATFAVKNMFGCVSGKAKAFWHFAKGASACEFCQFLIEIYRLLGPAVTVIDAVTVMQGAGPIRGDARKLGLLVGGTEPIACEYVCARLANIKPDELPMLRTARQIGFGCSDVTDVRILGDNPDDFVLTDFMLARPVPIRFSLPHVARSVCKQILLLLSGSATKAPLGEDNSSQV